MINNNVSNLKIIKVWNNPMQKAKIRKMPESDIIDHQNRKQNKRLYVIKIFNFHGYKYSVHRKKFT